VARRRAIASLRDAMQDTMSELERYEKSKRTLCGILAEQRIV